MKRVWRKRIQLHEEMFSENTLFLLACFTGFGSPVTFYLVPRSQSISLTSPACKKRCPLQSPMSGGELFPLLHSECPLHSYSLIFFFLTWRLLSVPKWWHVSVSRLDSSSDSFHSGCIINFTMSRTGLGLLASLVRVTVGFFWYPLHVTGMWAKLRQWPSFYWTESGTQTSPPQLGVVFGREQEPSALNGSLRAT